jgi:hypothetical protein
MFDRTLVLHLRRLAVAFLIAVACPLLIPDGLCAADLRLPLKPAVDPQSPFSPEAYKLRLFEEFLRFLRREGR